MRIDRLQLRTGLIILGLVAGFAAAGWWPAQRQKQTLRNRIDVAEQELGIARNRTDGLAKLAEEVQKLRDEVKSSNKEIPEQGEMASMLRELSVQIENENLTGQGINMLAAEAGADYLTLPVELTFSGQSLDAFRFVNRLERMPRLVQVESMTMRREPNSKGDRIKTSMRLNTFFCYVEERQP